jgi:hypothetical protein
LRTLLVGVTLLAAVCAYVAHEAEIVRERDAMRLDLKNLGWVAAGDPKPLTFVRQWLGDEGYTTILLPRWTNAEFVEKVKAVFPESKVGHFDRTMFDFDHWPKARPAQQPTQP